MSRVLAVDDVRAYLNRRNPPDLIINATGRVSTTGWTDGRLEPFQYIVPPADGILDIDFQATPPSGIVSQVICPIHASLSMPKPDWCRGVRVHASLNQLEETEFGGPVQHSGSLQGHAERPDGDPGDTWPWLVCGAKQTPNSDEALSERTVPSGLPVADLVGRPVRYLRESDMVTKDYFPDRVNIVVFDDRRVIKEIYFG